MHEFELTSDIDEMEAAELRATLSEFMEKHEENVGEFDDLQTEHEELQSEFNDAEAALDELKTKFAEEAADYINLSPEVIAERFSYSEISQIVDEGRDAEFSDDEDAEDETPESMTTFAEREEKGKAEGDDTNAKYREAAEQKLRQNGFLS